MGGGNPNLLIRQVSSFTNNVNDVPSSIYIPNIGNSAVQAVASELNFYGYNFINPNAVTCFIKLWEGVPHILTDTPKLILQIAANGSIVFFGSDAIMNINVELYITATTGYLPTDNTAPGTLLVGTIFYKPLV